MPIYEYECKICGHELEKLQRMGDPALQDCPECEEPELRKKISAAGFRLKGSGWYETDFKSGDKRNLHEGSEKKDGVSAKNGSKTDSVSKESSTTKDTKKSADTASKSNSKADAA